MATVKLTDKPVAEAVQDGDQVVLIQGGAVKRVAAEMVGTKWPTIDLYAAGVSVDSEDLGSSISKSFTVDAGLVTRIADAAMAGGALVNVGVSVSVLATPVQLTMLGSALEMAGTYQLSGKVSFRDTMINVAVWVEPNDHADTVVIVCPADPKIPLAETAGEGAFLRVRDGTWAAVQVPEAEEASF